MVETPVRFGGYLHHPSLGAPACSENQDKSLHEFYYSKTTISCYQEQATCMENPPLPRVNTLIFCGNDGFSTVQTQIGPF